MSAQEVRALLGFKDSETVRGGDAALEFVDDPSLAACPRRKVKDHCLHHRAARKEARSTVGELIRDRDPGYEPDCCPHVEPLRERPDGKQKKGKAVPNDSKAIY